MASLHPLGAKFARLAYGAESTILRELCLVKCSTNPPADTVHADQQSAYDKTMSVHFHKQALMQVASHFGATVVDIGSETLVLELVTWPRRVDAFLKMLKPFKIIEAARSGMIAMNRSKVVDPEQQQDSSEEDELTPTIDIADLPPS